MIFGERNFIEVNDEANRIGQKNRVIFRRNYLEGINDRRAIEERLCGYVPDLGKIPELHEKRSGDERERED